MRPVIVEFATVEFSWPGRGPRIQIPEFRLQEGQSAFVCGNSGAGKSTFLNLAAGVLTPAAGAVEVLGARFDQLGAQARDRVRGDRLGIIFQMFNLIPYLSLTENVAAPCWFSKRRAANASAAHGSPKAAARALLESLGLGAEADAGRAVAALSIGQQQRVAAARALIGAPSLVIADEPTSALDREARDQFLDLFMAEARRTRACVIFVSHDASLRGRFDRSFEIRDGVLREAAP